MKNKEIARLFYEIADFLEMKDINYKPRAYRKAARSIEALTEDIETIYENGELREIEGVGKALSGKIEEYLETGKLEYYEDLKKDLPVKIEELTRIEGMGPKSVKKLYDELGVKTLEDLEKAAKAGKVEEVKGFGEKVQAKILDNIETAKKGRDRQLLGKIIPLVEDLKGKLSDKGVFERIDVVGSYRRRRPTIGDLDVLATADSRSEAMDEFCNFKDVEEVLAKGETKSSIVVSGGVQVDLRVVDNSSYGSALLYFTGSKDHNVSLRSKAKRKDWKLNEYGLFDSEDEKLAGSTEEDVYHALDMSYIPPELRENTGEIEAAEKDSLPDLVKREDIRGDLQVHTQYSDGSGSVRDMAQKSNELGLDYLLISDHGPSLKIAGGPTEKKLEDQINEIEKVNSEMNLEVLSGIEANITKDGLDISKDWCERLDLVCVALHDRPQNPTERIISVFEEYPVDILVHPMGRRLLDRSPLSLNLDRIMGKAESEHIAIEINSQPERLDLDWKNVKNYRNKVKYVISTDAHSTAEMEFMDFGVSQARRGWCEKDDVLNTLSLEKVRSYLNG